MVNSSSEVRREASSFKIATPIAVLSEWKSETRGTHNTKEANRVSWNERNPVIDIRSWWIDENGEKKPGKGITLNEKEAYSLCHALVSLGYNEEKTSQ